MTPTRAFLLAGLACHALAQTPELPPRFEIPAGTPAISKPVQPTKFVESVGRRAALLGREDGTLEAWTMPVKVLRDFRLSVYFDGALEPVPLSDFAERVVVSPGRVTIVHSHGAFTIREDALSSWQAFALGHGGLTGPQAARAAASLNRPELSTDWGARLFATDSPSYDPLSYNDGSVWPFVNGFVTLAEYRHHQAGAALQHLRAAAALTGLPGAGFIPEYMSGDRAQQLPRAVPHQLFSSSAALNPLVSGMLGLEGDGLNRTLSFTPHLPAYWNRVSFDGYRVGASSVSGVIERSAGNMRVRLKIDGEPLRILLSPAFPAGSEVEAPGCRVERTGTDVHCATGFAVAGEIDVSYEVREGVEWIPDLAVTETGDRSKAVRLLDTETEPGRITFQFAGPAGTEFRPRFWYGDWKREGNDEAVRFPSNEGFTKVSIGFRNKGSI